MFLPKIPTIHRPDEKLKWMADGPMLVSSINDLKKLAHHSKNIVQN
jgi:hypothetical protein